MTKEFKTLFDILTAMNSLKISYAEIEMHNEKFLEDERAIAQALDDVVNEAYDELRPYVLLRMSKNEHIKEK